MDVIKIRNNINNILNRIIIKFKNKPNPYIRLLIFFYISLILKYPNENYNKIIIHLFSINEVKIILLIISLYISEYDYTISIMIILLILIINFVKFNNDNKNKEFFQNLKYNYLNKKKLDDNIYQSNVYNKKNFNITMVSTDLPVVTADSHLIKLSK